MALFDLLNDLIKVCLIVLFAREKDEISRRVLFIRVLACDLKPNAERCNDASSNASPTCLR